MSRTTTLIDPATTPQIPDQDGQLTQPADNHAEDHWCACAGAWQSCFADDERGMSTLEYALTALTAAAIATALYLVVSSGIVQDAFESLITDALNTRP